MCVCVCDSCKLISKASDLNLSFCPDVRVVSSSFSSLLWVTDIYISIEMADNDSCWWGKGWANRAKSCIYANWKEKSIQVHTPGQNGEIFAAPSQTPSLWAFQMGDGGKSTGTPLSWAGIQIGVGGSGWWQEAGHCVSLPSYYNKSFHLELLRGTIRNPQSLDLTFPWMLLKELRFSDTADTCKRVKGYSHLALQSVQLPITVTRWET